MAEKPPPDATPAERWLTEQVNELEGLCYNILRVCAAPTTALLRFLAARIKIDWQMIWSRLSTDPFFLRKYGESLLDGPAKTEIGGGNILIACEAGLILFAWFALWSYVPVHWFWSSLVLPLSFAGLEILIARGIWTLYDPGGKKRWQTIAGRVVFLLILSNITAIPVELKVFSPEIDKVIDARQAAKADLVRKEAIVQEEALEDKRAVASRELLGSAPTDVVARRKEERDAIVADQRQTRADITQRLEAKSDDLASEVGQGSRSGRTGDGPAAAAIRLQETDLRAELAAFNTQASEDLRAFDAETEAMRGGALQQGIDQQAAHATALDERLNRIKAMEPDQLVAEYGGEYKEPRGFLACYGILLELVAGSTRYATIFWGCKLLMIIFQLGVLFVKYGLLSAETKAYYNPYLRAQRGDVDAFKLVKLWAKQGDQEAINTLLALHDRDAETIAILLSLGYDATTVVVKPSREVIARHAQWLNAGQELLVARNGFENAFGDLCRERSESGDALTRNELVRRARHLWQTNVSPQIYAMNGAEATTRHRGVVVPDWAGCFGGIDPRRERQMLWELDEDELVREYGWSSPRVGLTVVT